MFAVMCLCMEPMRASHVQNNLVVDGVQFDYVSDVNIDSLLVDKPVPQDAWEWWLGAGWEVHASAAQPNTRWTTSSRAADPMCSWSAGCTGADGPHVGPSRRPPPALDTERRPGVAVCQRVDCRKTRRGPRPCVKWC